MSARVAIAAVLLIAASAGCETREAQARDSDQSLPRMQDSARHAVQSAELSAASAEAPPDLPSPPAVAGVARPCPGGMKWIPEGTLSTLERGHDVAVSGFCLDEREVTVGEFRACVSESGCKRECPPGAECPAVPKATEWNPVEDTKVSRLCNGHANDRDDHPLNCVSFGEAEAYCAAHDKRLPNGDEWEWASRGGPERVASPWGTAVAKNEICWGKPKKRASTCASSSFPKDRTPQGVLGMGGNVSEWTTPPKRNGSHSGVRWAYGASWYAIDDGYARAALGGMQMPAKRAETVGFRCASSRER